MNTKLTLNLEKAVIEKAKEYARNHGRSLSDLVESYLKLLTEREPRKKKKIKVTPIAASIPLKGKGKLPDDFDYKKELKKTLREKYGNDL